MEDDAFATLMQAAYFQQFPPQLDLIAQGEQADFLYIVVEGLVELRAKAEGRETTMAILQPISAFVAASVLKDEPYLTSARTLDKSRILLIPSSDVREAFARDAGLARALVHEVADAYHGAIKRLKDQKLRTGVERLANYLIALEHVQGSTGEVRLPVDKRTLAAFLGMTPENLSRAFATLTAHGVKVNGARIRLHDRADLFTVARPDPLIDEPRSRIVARAGRQEMR